MCVWQTSAESRVVIACIFHLNKYLSTLEEGYFLIPVICFKNPSCHAKFSIKEYLIEIICSCIKPPGMYVESGEISEVTHWKNCLLNSTRNLKYYWRLRSVNFHFYLFCLSKQRRLVFQQYMRGSKYLPYSTREASKHNQRWSSSVKSLCIECSTNEEFVEWCVMTLGVPLGFLRRSFWVGKVSCLSFLPSPSRHPVGTAAFTTCCFSLVISERH